MSPTAPYVELRFNDLGPEAIGQIGQRSLGDPQEILQSALMSYRLLVINHVKSELTANMDGGQLIRLLDIAAQLYLGKFSRVAGPVAAHAYFEAYRKAKAGEVPASMIYALAEEHTQRIGRYYNETNKEAILRGFNFLVNQKVPARVAAERVMDAYGLTPRQMSGYVAIKPPGQAAVTSRTLTKELKERSLNYVAKSLRSRFKIFAEQEAHNLDMQAKQTAWLWMSQKGILTEKALKVWITAKDEKVCPSCGPMHNKRVNVTEKFVLPSGEEVYVPGLHPNCRCEARVIDPGLLSKADDDDWEEHEHPRASNGRFTAKARQRATTPRPMPTPIFRPVGYADRPTPALEEMIAGAEKMREELRRRVEERAAEVEAKPKPLELTREKGLSLTRPVEVTRPLELTREKPLDLSTPAEPISVSRTSPLDLSTQRSALDLSLRERSAEIKQQREAITISRPKLPPKPEKSVRHVQFHDISDSPAYAVIEPGESDMSLSYQFNNRRAVHDDMTAIYEANQLIEKLMRKKVDDITGRDRSEHEMIPFTHYDHRHKKSFVGQIRVGDVERVVSAVAAEAMMPESMPTDETVSVNFENSDGDYMGTWRLSVYDLAHDMGIEADDFRVHIVRIDAVDPDISQHHPQSHGGYGHWDINGDYEAVAEETIHGYVQNQRFPIEMRVLRPVNPNRE